MSGKPFNGNGNGRLLGATVLSPADFPLGSPRSRAAARMLLAGSSQNLHEEDIRRCQEWLVSHKVGPMYWLRNCTKTENYHWKEQGLPPVAPFPFKPYLDRAIDVTLFPFEHEFGVGEPCPACRKLGQAHCIPDYLDVVMGYLLSVHQPATTGELWVPKTREMMTSWLVVGYITWFCQFYEKIEWMGQSEDDLKAQGLIKYANILYTNQPGWLRDIFPLRRGQDEGTAHKIQWANGSMFIGVPSGIRKLASSHPYGYFNDETAHQPGAEATINIAKPAVKQVVCVSSVAPGWMWDQVEHA